MIEQLQGIDLDREESYEIKVRAKRLNNKSTVPSQHDSADAGWDLYASEEVYILPGQRAAIPTGIALQIPEYVVGLIWPRSGLAVKKGIDVLAGVIDSGYRGEIKVCLLNTSTDICYIKYGDRVAQILFQAVPPVKMVEVDSLSSSKRDTKGFGSTGD